MTSEEPIDPALISKSARKREATALQELGVQLAGLPDAEMGGLDLPEDLVTALKALRRLSSRGAHVRQRHYHADGAVAAHPQRADVVEEDDAGCR